MVKFLNKVNHFIKRKVFKNLKYEFEEFIPNSAGRPKDINSLILQESKQEDNIKKQLQI